MNVLLKIFVWALTPETNPIHPVADLVSISAPKCTNPFLQRPPIPQWAFQTPSSHFPSQSCNRFTLQGRAFQASPEGTKCHHLQWFKYVISMEPTGNPRFHVNIHFFSTASKSPASRHLQQVNLDGHNKCTKPIQLTLLSTTDSVLSSLGTAVLTPQHSLFPSFACFALIEESSGSVFGDGLPALQISQPEPQHSVGQSTLGLFLCHQRTHIKQAIKKKKKKHSSEAGERRGCSWGARKSQEQPSADKALAPRQSPAGTRRNFIIPKGAVVAHQGGRTLNWCFCSSYRKAHGCHRAQKRQMDGERHLKLCACPKSHLKCRSFEQIEKMCLLIQVAGHLISVCFSLQLLYSQIIL